MDLVIDDELDDVCLLNQRTTARLLRIKPQLLQQWDVKPTKRRGREVLYNWFDVFDEYEARYYGVDGEDDEGGEAELLDSEQERARLNFEQANKVALENAVLRDELVYTADMAEVMGRALGAFRARLLSIPSKLAPLVNPRDPNLARDLIEREVTEVLAELADFDPDAESRERAADRNGPVRDAKAPSKVNGKRVGGSRKKAKSRK